MLVLRFLLLHQLEPTNVLCMRLVLRTILRAWGSGGQPDLHFSVLTLNILEVEACIKSAQPRMMLKFLNLTTTTKSIVLCVAFQHLSLIVRKPGFGVSDLVPHKPGCTTTHDG